MRERVVAAAAAAEEGGVAQAMVLVEQFRGVNPVDPWVRLLDAKNLTARRLFGSAEALLRAIETPAEVSPESQNEWRYVWLYRWAKLWDMRGEREAAEAAYRELTEVEAAQAGGWIFLGAWLARNGRLEEAEAAHRRATSLAGDVDEAYLNLGLVLRAQGRLEEAAGALERALELCAEYPEASVALADVRAAIALRREHQA
ncbi:MAG TPA: tetratricopeptide repeat protein [Kofleriaceae bacterium]|nr:tetratricopeptide repeat protein [Kofleriaceae bacterium]